MTLIYPAVFHQTENGRYAGYFPDLDDCTVEGDTLSEAMNEAIEAGKNWIYTELEEDDPFLPPVSDLGDITLQEGEFVRNIGMVLRLTDGFDE